MLIKEIDRKLDMYLILKVRQESEFFAAISDLELKLPSFIYDKDGKTWLSTYFPKNLKIPKVNLIINKFKASEREKTYVVDTMIENQNELSIIDKLVEIPSLIINGSDVYGGFLNVYARFHSSQLEKVSELLARYTSTSKNARIEWLGPSPGIMKIMDDINKEYPLSVVTYSTPINREDIHVREIPSSPKILCEVKSSGAMKGDINLVVSTDMPVEDLIPIDLSENLYQMELRSPFPFIVRNKANIQHIIRIAYFGKLQNGKIEVTVFLPTDFLYEFYSILYEVADETDNKVIVKTVIPYSQGVWDFI
ncbi:MAG: hypothetical protein ACYCSO_10250 [Cuniculiplasma sp.]